MKAQWFGRYLLLDKVASGGMAEVWRAKLVGEGNFHRIVAIKKILPHVCEDPDFISMFQDEANITVLLQHPNIGQVFEFSRHDDIYYLAMEYISGKDLKSIWSNLRHKNQVLPTDVACYVVQRMAEGLDYAHRKRDNFGNPFGIVHRDVSPQNCLLSWEGDVKVIDFGIAAAEDKASTTRAGTLKGKFAYMSPEQIRGFKLDGRADVFALGIILYELLTGERGFVADSDFALLEKVRNVEIKPPSLSNPQLPREVERIIFKALAKEREDRYASASDLAEDLQRFLLMNGKPPNAHTLGQFLRENFTPEYDKERLRLESYREAEADSPPPIVMPTKTGTYSAAALSGMVSGANPVAGAVPGVPAPPDAGAEAVAAALAADLAAPSMPRPAAALPARPAAGARAASSYVVGPRSDPTPVTGQRTHPRPPARPLGNAGHLSAASRPAPAAPAPPPARRGWRTLVGALSLFALLAAGGLAARLLMPGTGTLIVTVQGAPDATVRLDGTDVGQAAPSLTLDALSEGMHTLIVEKPGFLAHTAPVLIERDQVATQLASLKRMGGRLRVTSTPAGARVFLNDEDTGQQTPALLDDVESGVAHQVSVRLEGYLDATEADVQTKPAQERVLRLTLEPLLVRVALDTEPSGASVEMDGKALGETPLRFERDPKLPPPRLTIKKARCRPLETELSLSAGEVEQNRVLRLRCR